MNCKVPYKHVNKIRINISAMTQCEYKISIQYIINVKGPEIQGCIPINWHKVYILWSIHIMNSSRQIYACTFKVNIWLDYISLLIYKILTEPLVIFKQNVHTINAVYSAKIHFPPDPFIRIIVSYFICRHASFNVSIDSAFSIWIKTFLYPCTELCCPFV